MNAPSEVLFDVDQFEESVAQARGHLVCCEAKKFLCRAPYHPESEHVEGKEEIDCKPCVIIRVSHTCRVGHQHCPLREAFPLCPSSH